MKISIITVCYNSVLTLEETILSVLNQTYDDIEYIIIDGQSNDGTLDVINKYSDNIQYFISEKDLGIYDAMNKGIIASTGDVICMINSDDILMPKAVEHAVYYIKENKLDFYFGASYFSGGLVSGYNPKRMLLGMDYVGTAHSGGFFVKKQVHDYQGLYDLKYKTSSDYDFFMRIILAGYVGGAGSRTAISSIFRPDGFSSERSYIDKKKEECRIRLGNNLGIWNVIGHLALSVPIQLSSKLINAVKGFLIKLIMR